MITTESTTVQHRHYVIRGTTRYKESVSARAVWSGAVVCRALLIKTFHGACDECVMELLLPNVSAHMVTLSWLTNRGYGLPSLW